MDADRTRRIVRHTSDKRPRSPYTDACQTHAYRRARQLLLLWQNLRDHGCVVIGLYMQWQTGACHTRTDQILKNGQFIFCFTSSSTSAVLLDTRQYTSTSKTYNTLITFKSNTAKLRHHLVRGPKARYGQTSSTAMLTYFF